MLLCRYGTLVFCLVGNYAFYGGASNVKWRQLSFPGSCTDQDGDLNGKTRIRA